MYLIIISHIYVYIYIAMCLLLSHHSLHFTTQVCPNILRVTGAWMGWSSVFRFPENGCTHFALILVCKRKNVNLKSACSSGRHKDVPGGENPKFWATQAWRQKDTGQDAISLNHSEPTSQHISCAVDFSALSSRLGHLAPANIQRNPKNRNDWANAMQICKAANKSCPDDNFTNLATSK